MRNNMQRWSIVPLGACLICIGCSPARQAASQTEGEIASLEKHLADAPPTEEPTAEKSLAAPLTKLVSPGFKQASVTAGIALVELARATDSETAFDKALAEARAQVVAARSAVHNEHDRNAAIVLTALLAKQKELAFLNLLIQKNPTVKPDPDLTAEKEACSSELRAWLEGSAADAPELQRGPCLVTARMALAVLNQ